MQKWAVQFSSDFKHSLNINFLCISLMSLRRELKIAEYPPHQLILSRPSRDPYVSFKSQHRRQNHCSGLLFCRR